VTAPKAMLATLTDRPFSSGSWLFERKLDGVRALSERDGGAVALWSRNEKRIDGSFPELADALAKHGGPRFVADGEIVAFDGSQTSFSALQPRIHLTDQARIAASGVRVFYYLFDLLSFDGEDLRSTPLRERKRLLRHAFTFTDPLRLSAHRMGNGEEYFRQACSRGWEGLIAKRTDSLYQPGRTADWLKFKCVHDQEFVVGGFTDPKGSRSGFGALLVGYYDGDRLRYAGKVGTGYNRKVLHSLRERMGALETDASPFADRVREPDAHWIAPELVAQIGFTEWTNDGRLRHPRFTGLRNDKSPTEVVRETS
jgi:DNA ligase D-like protein (predicted ligase)